MDFRGEHRRRETHVSRTDPQALLYKKGTGQAAKLSYLGHLLTENRHGLVVDVELTQATGRAEREAAMGKLDRQRCWGGTTLGADRGYDTADFVGALRARGVTAHVAQHTDRCSAVDGRTTRHRGYGRSQRRRKLVEEVFGWLKTVGGGRKLRYRGLVRNRGWLELAAAAYNLVRMEKLEVAPQAQRALTPPRALINSGSRYKALANSMPAALATASTDLLQHPARSRSRRRGWPGPS